MADSGAPVINKGLDGVYITDSTICKVDGTAGRLYYRGYSIDEIAKNSNYAEVSYLLLYGRLPARREFVDFVGRLKEERGLPEEVVTMIFANAAKADPMDVLRTAVSYLSIYDNETSDASEAANINKSIRLISKVSSIVAAIGRCRKGNDYVEPDASLSHSENFLYMLNGDRPTAGQLRAVEMMFMLQAEHSSNASTFSTLVTGATLSDIYSAVTSGIGTLKGSLHGGADEEALRMMNAIGDPNNTETYIEEALAGKKKIMGFGHRVYKAYDPRAKIIKEYLLSLQNDSSPDVRRLTEIALRGEKLMIEKLGKSHGIWPNVDFFAGPVYVSAGIELELFTPMFAASRISGWCAHMLEYWKDNKLIRPLENYTGQLDLKYVPIDNR